MTRPAIPPPPCIVCGHPHDPDVHTSPTAAALEWARAVLKRAFLESAADFVSYPLAETTLQTLDGQSRFWASQTRLLMRRVG